MSKQFLNNIKKDNEALFEASRLNVKKYFDSNPSEKELIEHFLGRMSNERMNMVEISKQISQMDDNADPKELVILAKQAMDEAKHFKMVKEVIEHISGEEVDVKESLDKERSLKSAKGATILSQFPNEDQELVLALYQMIAEGRAEVVWNQMAESIEDEFITSRYRIIARDEGFHSNIGKNKLKSLVSDESKWDNILSIADKIRKSLYEISCKNTSVSLEGQRIVKESYSW